MRFLALPRRDSALVAGGALATVLAYPPFHLLLPSFTCLVPAVFLIQRANQDPLPVRRSVVQGFWFGLLSNTLVLYWMVVALWHFTPLSALGFFTTVVILGMFTSVAFGIIGHLVRRGMPMFLAFTVIWSAMGWLIDHLPEVGFPWLGLGTSLTGYPALIQIAEFVGARGITVLLVLANVGVAIALSPEGGRGRRVAAATAVLTVAASAAIFGMVRMRTLPTRPVGSVGLLQPNIGAEEKWDRTRHDSLFTLMLDQSAAMIAADRPDLVLWPEAAVPDYFFRQRAWDRALAHQADSADTDLLVGGQDVVWYADGEYDYYNAAFLYDTTGSREAQPAYHKRFLVPIVERVPFIDPRWLNLPFFGGFGVGAPGPVYQVGIGRFGVLICYESAFESAARDYRERGAEFLVNITNDAWFGRSSAPWQHAAHLVMRAIETRTGIARAANSGVSGFVDPLGRYSQTSGLYEVASVVGTLTTSDVTTLYVRWGDWVGWLMALLAAGMVGWLSLTRPASHRLSPRETP